MKNSSKAIPSPPLGGEGKGEGELMRWWNDEEYKTLKAPLTSVLSPKGRGGLVEILSPKGRESFTEIRSPKRRGDLTEILFREHLK
jgi:hypothetical protein